MKNSQRTIFFSILVIMLAGLGILTRFFPHPANFTAVGATALFAGACFPKKWGMLIPLVIMVVSDLFIGFHELVLFTWGSMALSGLIGVQLRGRTKPLPILSGALFASIQFYLITNWAVWQFGTMYSRDLSGLFASYVAGLPFFRNMMFGDIVYSGVLFGLYALALYGVRRFAVPGTAGLRLRE